MLLMLSFLFLSRPCAAVVKLPNHQSHIIYTALGEMGLSPECSNGGCTMHGKIDCHKMVPPGSGMPEKDSMFLCEIVPDPNWLN